jgi:hypothetical protein
MNRKQSLFLMCLVFIIGLSTYVVLTNEVNLIRVTGENQPSSPSSTNFFLQSDGSWGNNPEYTITSADQTQLEAWQSFCQEKNGKFAIVDGHVVCSQVNNVQVGEIEVTWQEATQRPCQKPDFSMADPQGQSLGFCVWGGGEWSFHMEGIDFPLFPYQEAIEAEPFTGQATCPYGLIVKTKNNLICAGNTLAGQIDDHLLMVYN